jgi:hypothetical protein
MSQSRVTAGRPQCHWLLNEQLDGIGIPITHAHIGGVGNVAAADLWLDEHYPAVLGRSDEVRLA